MIAIATIRLKLMSTAAILTVGTTRGAAELGHRHLAPGGVRRCAGERTRWTRYSASGKTASQQEAGDRNVARQRNALERRQGERENAGCEQGECDPAVRTRRQRRFVAGLQRCGRRHGRRLASGPERGDQRGADAEQEENEGLDPR